MKIALIVPAYKPADAMLEMLRGYMEEMDCVPVVINDGSGAEYDALFARLPEGCVLINHDRNQGKGMAIKTGMRHVLERLPECDVIGTADADGQFRRQDVRRVCEAARQARGALVLGVRTFEGDVPILGRVANAATRLGLDFAAGVRLRDVLTGLRAFGRDLLEPFLGIQGERYEYEINVLLHAAQEGVSILQEPVLVHLEGKSADVHFNPLRDTVKIYMRILLYMGTSLFAFCVDFVMLLVMKALTAGLGEAPSLMVSVAVARLISAALNFVGNKHLVYRSKGNLSREISKYAGSVAFILAANYVLLHALTITLDLPLVPSKLLVETLLFFVNFKIQGKYVYRKKTDGRRDF